MKSTLDAGLLSKASQSVEAQLGLHYPPERWADLERGLRGAAAELGFGTVEACAEEFLRAGLNRMQIDALAAHLTIGETYFFREPAVFEALTTQILPAIADGHRNRAKRLRIWSAGCCTGEEPYSIAIALRRAIPDLHDWQVTILATDINSRFLHKAMDGVYGSWSFRGVPEEIRSVYFRRTPDGRFAIVPSIRKMVAFACLNLVEDIYPALANNTAAMDLILCRNLLMYFSRAQMRKVTANLHRALVEGGRLVVSATEASQELFGAFSAGEIPGIALYRKQAGAPRLAPAAPPPAPHPVRHQARAKPQAPPRKPSPSPRAAAPAPPPDHAAEARRLANEGRLGDALGACERALSADKLVPAHHFLRGVILQEQNALDEAAAALRRALYLDPDFAVAHFTLGHLLVRLGRQRQAARSFANARSLLQQRPAGAVVPEAEGMTAGRLLELITSTEEALA